MRAAILVRPTFRRDVRMHRQNGRKNQMKHDEFIQHRFEASMTESARCGICGNENGEPHHDESMAVRDRIAAGRYENKVSVQDRAAYRTEEGRIIDSFKADLEKEHGTSAYQKRDELFGVAWEKGHSSGLEEVANVYEDLIRIIVL